MRGAPLLLLLCACPLEESFVPFPELASAGAVLLVEPDPLAIEALDLEAKYERRASEDGAGLFLVAYRASLEDLRLELGPLELAESCRSCALRRPDQVFSSLNGEPFAELADRPAWLLDALVPDRAGRCDACPVTLRSERILHELVDTGGSFHLLPWTSESVLFVGMQSGSLARLWLDGTLEPLCRPSPELGVFVAAMRPQGDELWVVLSDSSLSSLRLLELDPALPCGLGLVPRAPTLGLPIKQIAGPPDQSPPDLYALASTSDSQASVHRFRNGAWTQVAEFSEHDGELSLIHTSDGWTYAVAGLDEIFRARNDEFELLRLTGGDSGREVTAVAEVPGFGVLLADRFELLLTLNANGGFDPLGNLPVGDRTGDRPRAIIGFGPGIFTGTSRGEVRYFDPTYGYCLGQPGLFGRENSVNLISLANETVFSGFNALYRAERTNQCPL